MKKLLLAVLLSVVTSQSWAVAANDMRFTQRDATNTANLARDIPFPGGGANGAFIFDGANILPKAATLGGGLVYNGTSLTTSAIPQANVSGLTTALAGKLDTPSGTTSQYVRGDGSLATFPSIPSLPIAIGDVTGLQTALDGKVPTTRTVNGYALTGNISLTKADVGLGNVDNTADASKVFAASQVTSGTFADGRIAQSNVTQHQAALSIASSQVTGTKTSAYISDFTEAAQDGVGAALSSEFVYNDGSNSISLRQRSFTNNASRSIITTAAAANGFQVSSTRDAAVNYNVTSSTTATIGGASSITVLLEVAPTNSSTASDWVEISRFSNGQTVSLAVVLQSVQTGAGNLGGIIPAGYYVRLRQVVSGTASASYNTGQEVLL